MRAADGAAACAREGRLQCGGLIDADRRDQLDFGRAGSARCGARGGPNAVACCRVVGRCRPYRRGPLPRLWCAWGTSAFCTFCQIVRGGYPELEFTFFCATHTVRKSIQNNVQPLGRFLRGPTFSSEGLAASAAPSRRGAPMKSSVIGLARQFALGCRRRCAHQSCHFQSGVPSPFRHGGQPHRGRLVGRGASTWRAHDASFLGPSVAQNVFGQLWR